MFHTTQSGDASSNRPCIQTASQAADSQESVTPPASGHAYNTHIQDRQAKVLQDPFQAVLEAAKSSDAKAQLAALKAAGIDLDVRDESGQTPLLAYATQGNWDACILLLAAGANPQCVTADGRTLLRFISEKESGAALLCQFKDQLIPSLEARDANGQTPLWYAVRAYIEWHTSGSNLRRLIAWGANFNTQDNTGRWLIFYAVTHPDFHRVSRDISLWIAQGKLDVAVRDTDGTPLFYPVYNAHWRVGAAVLKALTQLEEQDMQYAQEVFTTACNQDQWSVIYRLVTIAQQSQNLQTQLQPPSNWKLTPQSCEAVLETDDAAIIRFYRDLGGDVMVHPEALQDAFLKAVRTKNIELFNTLLPSIPKPKGAIDKDSALYTALQSAIKAQSWSMVDGLLAHGAYLNKADTVLQDQLTKAQELEYVKNQQQSFDASKQDPSTELVIGARENDLETVKRSVGQSSIGAQNKALGIAAMNGHVEVATCLLANGADVNAPEHAEDTSEPLVSAVFDANLTMLRLLAPHSDQPQKDRAFMAAIRKRYLEMAQCLRRNGASINASHAGSTPLRVAELTHQDPVIIQWLVTNGAQAL